MGLDLVTEGYPHRVCRSYSGFHKFREIIAACNGWDLNRMQGFGGDIAWPDDPLTPFLNHSDADGSISWTLCGALHDSLEIIFGDVAFEACLIVLRCDLESERAYAQGLLDLLKYCCENRKELLFR